MLKKIFGNKSVMFNLIGWCIDMVGVSLVGICNVFGNVVKICIKLCEFYFKDYRNKKVSKFDSGSFGDFKVLCD